MTPGEEADAAVASAGGAAAEASVATSTPPPAQEQPASAPLRPQPQAAKPVHGIRLVLSVLWERVKRFFARLVGRGEK